jgi:Taurine catabolism dioxygenase TauD, TfdA family
MRGLAARESAPGLRAGYVHVRQRFASVGAAWAAATTVIESASGNEPLEVIGEFVIPPVEGPAIRSFQTLHIDFGVPLTPKQPADVARFTALHIAADARPSQAHTRLVELASLLSRRTWPGDDELVRRFAAYGRSHGAWDDSAGYVEGSLARVVEAATGADPVLPSVKTTPGFRCGLEFASLAEEVRFFGARGLSLEIEHEVRLEPGELLIFDNLLVAHGRRGSRQPGELHQRVIGHRQMSPSQQRAIRDRFLVAFH